MLTFIDVNKTKKDKITFNRPGEYVAFMYNLSKNVTFDIRAENVDLSVYGIYVGQGAESYNLESTQLHSSPNSTSNLFIKGVFFDESKFLYKGLIRIEKKAAGTTAYQKNQNLKLSAKAFVESDPFLEILNNNVKCGHGSSTGKLNEEELYYLQTRGLTRSNAAQLLIDGFVNEIINEVKGRVNDFSFVPQYSHVKRIEN